MQLISSDRCLNVLAVRFYGEAEFWLSGGKVILLTLLFCFTFITMVGGNPQHVRISYVVSLLEYELRIY
jgi:amino acid permease